MKKAISTIVAALVLLCVLNVLEAKTFRTSPQEVTVYSTDEFLRAIAPNTTIYVDLDEYDAIMLTGNYPQKLSKYIHFEEVFDGVQLVISEVENLSIIGREDFHSLFLSPYRYANVLTFVDCQDITLQWLNCGHDVEGYCTGGVLAFDNCDGVKIENCDLWGCGTEGLSIYNSAKIECAYTTIRECSYSIMTVHNSSDIKFQYCLMYENREFDLFNFKNASRVRFDSCVIWNNRCSGGIYASQLVSSSNTDITFSKCAIFNNRVDEVSTDSRVKFLSCNMFNNRMYPWEFW